MRINMFLGGPIAGRVCHENKYVSGWSYSTVECVMRINMFLGGPIAR